MSPSLVLLAVFAGLAVGIGYACAQYALILLTRERRYRVRRWLERQGELDDAVFAAEDTLVEAQQP